MIKEDIEKTRIQLAGLALQGMLERESSWSSKIISDLMYEKLAKHCVKMADAILKELLNTEFEDI
jgi:hypothetical protein